MQFDFERFTKLFARAYPVARYGRIKQSGTDSGLFSYNDALEVFQLYFSAYEYYTGYVHPPLKRGKIVDLIQRMDSCETPENSPHSEMDFEPEDYPDLIRAHFQTKYRNCDYNICHFFSGCIRYLRCWDAVITDRV